MMTNVLKNLLTVMLTVLSLNILFSIPGYSTDEFNKYAKIKMVIQNRHELEMILEQGISMEQFKGKFGQEIELIVNYHELGLLHELEKSPEILIPDMREYYKNRPNPTTGEMKKGYRQQAFDHIQGYTLGSMGGFHTRDEHIAIGNYLHNTYPNIVSPLIFIGQTQEGVNIYAQRISDNPTVQESGEGNVYFDGLIHAREPIGGEVLLYYLYWLVENYDNNPEAEYLINNRQIYMVTVLNADGYLYNQITDPNGGGMWRKNRRNNGGSYGVDLNRNYGYQWGYDNTGSSPTPSSETYRGPSPFSEPETQAVRDFILAIQPSIGFNCHTYSGVFINPYGYSGIPTSYEYYSEFAGDFAHFMNYPYGTSAEMIGYPSNGTARDWMHHDGLCFTWVPEIGETGFWPSSNEIILINSQFLPILKYLTWVSGNYADYQKYHILEGQTIPGDTISIVVEVKNKGLSLDATGVEINMTSLNNMAVSINSSATIDTIHSWHIRDNNDNPIKFVINPSAIVMDELLFRIDIKQDNILTSSDTISMFVGEQNVLFADNAENGFSTWTNGGFGQQWDTTFVNYFSKWHSFADSRYGSYSDNSTNYCTTTNVISLAGSENPRLEYAAKWALEPDYDYVRIEISANGGVSWTALSGRYTVNVSGQPGYTRIGKGWRKESIDLAAFKNQQVKFRFRLNTDGGLNTDGFYFDDFRVVDYKTPVINSSDGNNYRPIAFELKQNFPNPFNPATTIAYTLPDNASVEISVFNTLGEKIKTLVQQVQSPGNKRVVWNGLNENKIPVVSGLYFITIQAKSNSKQFEDVKKCIILR